MVAPTQTAEYLAWLGFFTEARRLAELARIRRAGKLAAGEESSTTEQQLG